MTGSESNLSHNENCLTESQTPCASDGPPLKKAPGGDNGNESREDEKGVSQSELRVGSPL